MRLRSSRTARVACAAAVVALGSTLATASVAAPTSYAAPAAAPADPGAVDPGAGGTDPDPGTPLEVAQDNLTAAQDLADGTGQAAGADPTLVLNELAQTLDDLPPTQQRQARSLLARPTDGSSSSDLFSYPASVTVKQDCLTHVCVHYAASGVHAPPPGDANADGVNDWAHLNAVVMEKVWADEVSTLGYRHPVADHGASRGEGPDTRLDVYLGDIGGDGYYGYAATDNPNARTGSAYLVLDDDFEDFPGTPGLLMRVTAAHEFFHVVQFAYDSFEDGWFMEATATWMEEQVYDTVNDNRQYVASSSLRLPMRSLDYPLPAATPYGNWVFFQFLSEKLGREPIHSMWYRASKSGVYSTLAIRRALEAEGTTLPYRFLGFSSSGMFPGRSFSEGSAFPKAVPSDVWTFGTGKRGTGSRSVRLDHLTGRNYAFWPGSSLTGSWRLKVTVNGPSGISGAMAIVERKDGTLVRKRVSLSSSGNGTAYVAFSRASVKRVTLTLVNSSSRFECGSGQYSCNGSARDQNKLYTWSATAVR